MEGMTLKDLTPVVKEGASNLIDLTDKEKLEIVELLKQGKSFGQVKKEFKRVVGESHLSASIGQIKEVEMLWKAKLAELTPAPKEEVIEGV